MIFSLKDYIQYKKYQLKELLDVYKEPNNINLLISRNLRIVPSN